MFFKISIGVHSLAVTNASSMSSRATPFCLIRFTISFSLFGTQPNTLQHGYVFTKIALFGVSTSWTKRGS